VVGAVWLLILVVGCNSIYGPRRSIPDHGHVGPFTNKNGTASHYAELVE
jgi:hypothetical protein